jgi:hypothetical protein
MTHTYNTNAAVTLLLEASYECCSPSQASAIEMLIDGDADLPRRLIAGILKRTERAAIQPAGDADCDPTALAKANAMIMNGFNCEAVDNIIYKYLDLTKDHARLSQFGMEIACLYAANIALTHPTPTAAIQSQPEASSRVTPEMRATVDALMREADGIAKEVDALTAEFSVPSQPEAKGEEQRQAEIAINGIARVVAADKSNHLAMLLDDDVEVLRRYIAAPVPAAPADKGELVDYEHSAFNTWFSRNGFSKYRDSMWAAWEERARQAAAIAEPVSATATGWTVAHDNGAKIPRVIIRQVGTGNCAYFYEMENEPRAAVAYKYFNELVDCQIADLRAMCAKKGG